MIFLGENLLRAVFQVKQDGTNISSIFGGILGKDFGCHGNIYTKNSDFALALVAMATK